MFWRHCLHCLNRCGKTQPEVSGSAVPWLVALACGSGEGEMSTKHACLHSLASSCGCGMTGCLTFPLPRLPCNGGLKPEVVSWNKLTICTPSCFLSEYFTTTTETIPRQRHVPVRPAPLSCQGKGASSMAFPNGYPYSVSSRVSMLEI